MYPQNVNAKWITNAIKQYILLHKSDKGYNYRIFQTKFGYERYLNLLYHFHCGGMYVDIELHTVLLL